MCQTARTLRDSTLPRTGSWSISEAILIAGQAIEDTIEAPFLPQVTDLTDPRAAEAELRRSLPAWQTNWTSDD